MFLWGNVTVLEARVDKETQLGTAPNKRLIATEVFVGLLRIPLVSFDERAIDVKREA